MNQPATPGGPPPPEFQTPAPPPDGASRGLLIAILSALGVILIGGLVTGAFLMGRSSDPDKDPGDDVAADATTSSSSSSTTVAPTTAALTTQAPPATAAPGPRGVGDVLEQPAGLFCRDLADAGYDTYDALSYYLMWGLPSHMDADGDTIPCETVYPDAEWVWFNAAF